MHTSLVPPPKNDPEKPARHWLSASRAGPGLVLSIPAIFIKKKCIIYALVHYVYILILYSTHLFKHLCQVVRLEPDISAHASFVEVPSSSFWIFSKQYVQGARDSRHICILCTYVGSICRSRPGRVLGVLKNPPSSWNLLANPASHHTCTAALTVLSSLHFHH